jgi:dUTP pyrophosphatase
MKVPIKIEPGAVIPIRMSPGSAGYDLFAFSEHLLTDGQPRAMVRTGIKVQIPYGYEGQIRLRSGMVKEGLMLANSVGCIDSDYRGEIYVPLYKIPSNYQDPKECVIKKGLRIAQLLLKKVEDIEFEVVDELDETIRGVGGFGSTGK